MVNEKTFAQTMLDETIAKLGRGNTQERACAMILRYGDTGDEHHKQWLIDQLFRLLAGSQYQLLTMTYEQGVERDWDTGIAP